MNAKEYDEVLKALSRRNFLRTGSAALAMTALAGATALGQERSNTKAAEHDHSSNDPGQENKPLWMKILIRTCHRRRIMETWFRYGILSI
jgi:hypothetical protein